MSALPVPDPGPAILSGAHTGTVLAPSWLGDALMCLPALEALRAASPGIDWRIAARPSVAEVLTLAGWNVVTLPRPRSLKVSAQRTDCVIVFPNSLYSALLARRLGRIRIGYRRDGRGWLLTHAFSPPTSGQQRHESFYYLELLRSAGIIDSLPAEDPAKLRVPLRPSPESVAVWRERLGGGTQGVVAMHCGATFGTAKRWMPERFAALARRLLGSGLRVVLIGSRDERDLAEEIRGGTDVINLAGETTLTELAALLASARLLVANDSGPMHLAAAVGTPVVALFGSTNDRETYPLTEPGKLRIVKAPGIECSPCKLRECPIDHRCMTRLEVDTVYAAAQEMLASNGAH